MQIPLQVIILAHLTKVLKRMGSLGMGVPLTGYCCYKHQHFVLLFTAENMLGKVLFKSLRKKRDKKK